MGQYFYLDVSHVYSLPWFITISDPKTAFLSFLPEYLFHFGTDKAWEPCQLACRFAMLNETNTWHKRS